MQMLVTLFARPEHPPSPPQTIYTERPFPTLTEEMSLYEKRGTEEDLAKLPFARDRLPRVPGSRGLLARGRGGRVLSTSAGGG